MKPLLFIYNPHAGKGNITSYLSEIIQIFTKYNWISVVYPTQQRGDAKAIVLSMGKHFQRIVCAGGDGTLSEVAEGLLTLEDPPALGYIPFGSTNDSANTLHLPKNPLQAAEIAATGCMMKQDAGEFNGRPFIYVAAFGAFTAVSYDVPQEWKNAFGNLAYFMGGVASLPTIAPKEIQVEYDGRVIRDKFFYGMVCNSYTVGGLKALSEESVKLDDGEFEVVLIRKADGLAAGLSALQSLLWKVPLEDSSVLSFRAKDLTFTSTEPLSWSLDGEFGGEGTCHHIVNNHRVLTVVHGDTHRQGFFS